MGPLQASRDRPRWLAWAALIVVYFVWGTTYLCIRVGVRHLPPLVFAGVRYIVAGALLYPVAARAAADRGGPGHPVGRPGRRAWMACAVVGVLLLFGGNGGVTDAETRLPSGLAAILVATVPLWIVVFGRLVGGQPITWRACVGLVTGLVGVVVLAAQGGGSGRIGDIVIVLVAAASWGLGSVLGHRLALPTQAPLAAAMEMLIGGVALVAVAAATGEFSHLHLGSVPTTGWIALAYLIGPGSILAFSAYGYALANLPVTTVSTYAYVNPVVALGAGVVILGEHLSWPEAIGAAVVLCSLLITMRGPRAAEAVATAGDPTGQEPSRDLSFEP